MTHTFKTKRHQGDWGLMHAMQYFISEGYECFVPLSEATRVDLVVMREQEILRVQVKTSTYSATEGRSHDVTLATSGGNQSWNRAIKTLSAEEVDVVFIWCSNETYWLFPISELEGKRAITVGHHNAEGHLVGGELPALPARSSLRSRKPSAKEQTVQRVYEPLVCPIDGCSESVSRAGRKCRSHAAVEANKSRSKTQWLPDEALVEAVREKGFSLTARELGVSDNAVRKRLRTRGLLPIK